MSPNSSEGSPWLTTTQESAWRAYMGLSLQMTFEMNRQLTEGHGLSLADYSVLVALADSPDGRCRVTDLAAEIGWERSRASHHLARMCARGLTDRAVSTTDGRATDAVLTEAGRAALDASAPGHVELVHRLFFDGLATEEVDALGSILTRLRDHVRTNGTLPRPQ
ncbi:MarR family transcriptional regulator [Rhodococcus sp. 06-462-5]|uniref:MarR family winged helix-turn-helix transcriptional regulator n=1 Tax=unclassified Rhodococcus (in: high G+C Gram-positive bacteria) TaxID=192944 RepID=UPI000B9A45DE|nr:MULTISPECIES: MarR family winged helix-turn-helix transcriptional regulator [unclassified Rhodococcus (in: high G+C Gram-positive bacteria)]OZC76714.1 MarR family transcriptional regulator [Rhodococcus sp. 06-462-5]OZE64780.1 MarR family transcriptional regulator [Rhodococcus sp. 02-925g]